MATPELDELRKQLNTLQSSYDNLLKSLAASNGSFGPDEVVPHLQRNATLRGVDAVFADTSTLSDDSSDDEEFFVQDELPSHSFDHEHLREHLRTHDWTEHGRAVLASLVTDPAKLSKQPHLFHLGPGPAEDRSHYSHFQYARAALRVLICADCPGFTMSAQTAGPKSSRSKAQRTPCPTPPKYGTLSEQVLCLGYRVCCIIDALQDIGNTKEKPTVGRITYVPMVLVCPSRMLI